MSYADLDNKFKIIRKKFKDVSNKAVAKAYNRITGETRDKTTIGRNISDPDKLDARRQDALVQAVCEVVKTKYGIKASPDMFRGNNNLEFYKQFNISKIEAAQFLGKSIPVPDIFFDIVFTTSRHSHNDLYVGQYLIFRIDKEAKPKSEARYIQACATIYEDNARLLVYADEWSGDGTEESYGGYVFPMDHVVHIVGERTGGRGAKPRPEIWWCGLESRRRKDHIFFWGHVSDCASDGTLFTDRIVLVRSDEASCKAVRDNGAWYVTRERVLEAAGKDLLAYLDEWADVPIISKVKF